MIQYHFRCYNSTLQNGYLANRNVFDIHMQVCGFPNCSKSVVKSNFTRRQILLNYLPLINAEFMGGWRLWWVICEIQKEMTSHSNKKNMCKYMYILVIIKFSKRVNKAS